MNQLVIDKVALHDKEQQFAQTVAEQKSTIYTVCYMFSQDADEVNDLFQEVLVNLWKGFENFEHCSINVSPSYNPSTVRLSCFGLRTSVTMKSDRSSVSQPRTSVSVCLESESS